MSDIIGQRFGRLTIIGDDGTRDKCDNIKWLCKCDCGNTKNVILKSLKRGATKSCGCIRKEMMTKHGESTTRLYGIWEHMVRRTSDINNERYGGRGISLCDEWFDYSTFSKWAKENGYEDNLSIDRIDVNGNYESSNCRWATDLVQANNRTTNMYIEYNGKEQSLSDWARELDLDYSVLRTRFRRGWSVDRAFNTPKQNKIKNNKGDK